MEPYWGSIASGYVDALNQMQQRDMRAQQMRAQQQAMEYQAWQMQQQQNQQRQQQLAQQNAANAYSRLLEQQQAPQIPVGMPNGAQAPEPGQASVPAAPPGPPPGDQMPPQGGPPPGMMSPPGQNAPMGPPGGPGAMPPQVPVQGPPPSMPPQGPPPMPQGGPQAGGPPPIAPYQAPGATPPPGPPQVPMQGAPGQPPGPQGLPGAPPGGISLETIAQKLSQQGVKGQDMYQALMSAMPLMDAQSKVQMAMISQQFRDRQMALQEEQAKEQRRHHLETEKTGRQRVEAMGKGDSEVAEAWSPEALEQAAHDMLLSGATPSLGAGKEAQKIRGLIANRRAELAKELGLSPAQVAALPRAAKADAASLLQATKRYDAVTQAENAAIQSGEMAQKLSEQVAGLGDIKLFNELAIAGQTQFNDPTVASYLVALDAFKKEYVRVMTSATSNAMPTEGAQHRANELLGQGTSPAALKARINTLKQDMEIIQKTSLDQMNAARQRLANLDKYYTDEPTSGHGPAAAPGASKPPPPIGTVQKGYRFKGGDPVAPTSWEKVQ